MAVKDVDYLETDTFILPSKQYFPLSITVAHYQLRHYISSSKPDIIYYADRKEVYSLNVTSRERSHIATLPFESRCTASGYGWICIGGEREGEFVAIKLHGSNNSQEVDAVLPLDLGTSGRNRNRDTHKPLIHKVLGQQIVNSVSIHKLPDEGSRGQDEVVAVFTNNDKTVRVYSLSRDTEVVELKCPFAMNHATISPDGNLLIAVGDEQRAFFYGRSQPGSSESSKNPSFEVAPHTSTWTLIATVHLHCPVTREDIGYFTTAWSPSGALCAAGSESGYITIFETELIKTSKQPENAIRQVIKSSRPDFCNGPGSVRTMLFSPTPWDLLIWSEDQGRMCVADLRTGLSTCQILQLDCEMKGFEKLEMNDVAEEQDAQYLAREIDRLRRFRQTLDSEGNASTFSYNDNAPERRRNLRRLGIVESDNDPNGLTPHEQRIIEALMVSRDRDGDVEQAIAPRSINYLPPSSSIATLQRLQAQTPQAHASSVRDTDIRSEGINPRDTLRDRYSDSERRSSQPHRQASTDVLGQESGGNVAQNSSSRATPNTNEQDSVDSWPLREASLSLLDPGRDYPFHRAWMEFSSTSEMRRYRQIARNAREGMRAREPLQAIVRRGTPFTHDPAAGVRTAGLATSQDGKQIYVGAENGIYIFTIDALARKLFPATHFR